MSSHYFTLHVECGNQEAVSWLRTFYSLERPDDEAEPGEKKAWLAKLVGLMHRIELNPVSVLELSDEAEETDEELFDEVYRLMDFYNVSIEDDEGGITVNFECGSCGELMDCGFHPKVLKCLGIDAAFLQWSESYSGGTWYYKLLNADAWELLYEPRSDSALDDRVAVIRPVDWEEESIPLREFVDLYRKHRELFQT